jgi:FkbM family methyltransferase
MGAVAAKIKYFALIFLIYRRETSSTRDYLRLLQVRLARSRFVGRFVCPQPVVRTVTVASFGGPITLRSHTTDVSVLDELLISHSYANLLGILDPEATTIVDLGANIGLAARWLCAAFPRASVLAVEPEPGNVAVLQRNLGELDDKAVLEPVAVSDVPGHATISTTSGEHGFSLTAGQAGVEVPVTTVADLFQTHGVKQVDLLKCDIEGSERDVFADCREWIGNVGLLEIECHEPYRLADLIGDLDRNGASFELLDHSPNPAFGCETALLRNTATA